MGVGNAATTESIKNIHPKSPEINNTQDLEDKFVMPNFITLSFQERQK